MIGFVYDDGGCAEAQPKRHDCVARALAILLRETCDPCSVGSPRAPEAVYEAVFDELAGVTRLDDQGWTPAGRLHRSFYEPVFLVHGLRRVTFPRSWPRPTLTEAWERWGACLFETRGHIGAIADGRLRDTSDWRWVWRRGKRLHQRKARAVWLPAATVPANRMLPPAT